jgi:hypothetical protein
MAGNNHTQGKKRKQNSAVWPNFTRLEDDRGNKTGMVECNRCHKPLAGIHGTSSLRKHVKVCSRQEDAPEAVGPARQPHPQPPRAPSRPVLSSGCRKPDEPGLEEARKHLARMIALRGHDPSVVEDDCFRSFVGSLNPEFMVPSREAIEEMCDGIFDEARSGSFYKLRSAPGRLSFAVGKAKTRTIEAGEVIYIACHFIDDEWNLRKVVMDALVPEGHHEYPDGAILGLDMAGDAAAYVMDAISDHVYNLALVAYDIGDDDNIHTRLKDYIAGLNSGTNLSSTTTTYVDNVLHNIARYLLPDSDSDSATAVFENMMHLHLTRQERLQLVSELGLDYKWAYDEHWCAYYYSLKVLCKRGLIPGTILKLLCKVWGQVYRGIQRISAPTCPTSNLCLAEFLKLREILHSEIARFSEDDPDFQDRKGYFYERKKVVKVLGHASDTLDKAIQNSYLVWSVPLALDPRYKLSYIEFSFQRAFGTEAGKYISEVTKKINKMYADYIKEYGTITDVDHFDCATTTFVDPWDQAWNDHRGSRGVMTTQVNTSCPETQTELDLYMQDPLALGIKETDFDILNWWKENCQKYPIVARMARDALAMPTCSKLSSDQIAQVRSILRSYSKNPYSDKTFSSPSEGKGSDTDLALHCFPFL